LKKWGFKRDDAVKSLPDPLRHRASREGVVGLWKEMARVLYSPRVLSGLPPFAEVLAKTFWEVEVSDVIDAMMNGDPAFFVAFQIKLDQIDVALVDAGNSIAQRAPVVRCKYTVDGFRLAAVENLERFGGKWPPGSTDAERV